MSASQNGYLKGTIQSKGVLVGKMSKGIEVVGGGGMTEEQQTQLAEAYEKAHEHENKEVLDGFSVNEDEQVLYNGEPIGGKDEVYIGNGEMPDGYCVQIDPEGEVAVVPTMVSELENDSGFITAKDIPVNRIETTETTTTLQPNTEYSFGECESLTLEFAEGNSNKRNEYLFSFTSGTTATVLSLPVSVQWVNELTVEANKRYEISVVDNIGLWCAVEVSV